MIISCNSCKSRFNIPEKKIPPKGTKTKCPKCGGNIVIPPRAAKPKKAIFKSTPPLNKSSNEDHRKNDEQNQSEEEKASSVSTKDKIGYHLVKFIDFLEKLVIKHLSGIPAIQGKERLASKMVLILFSAIILTTLFGGPDPYDERIKHVQEKEEKKLERKKAYAKKRSQEKENRKNEEVNRSAMMTKCNGCKIEPKYFGGDYQWWLS